MKLDVNGFVLWGTYYGGTGNDRTTSLRYFFGALYLHGGTYSTAQIATPGAHKTALSGGEDAFIAKFDNLGCETNLFGKMVRPALCRGDSSGIAAVIITSTSGNPTFKWKTNPPQFNDTAVGLPGGVYEVVVSNSLGCLDSVKVVVTESVLVPSNMDVQICEGKSIWINGTEVKTAGKYNDTLKNSRGCDSIVIWNVLFVKQINHSFNVSICAGENAFFGNRILSATGTYYDTLLSFMGCDSFVTLYLDVLSSDTSSVKKLVCSDKPFYYKQTRIDSTGIYIFKERSYRGCDSILFMEVEFVECEGCLTPWIPNAFSPVKDGLNDFFRPLGNCPYQSYEFMIFNRWGEILFKTNDPFEAWDGNYLGIACCQGVYGWMLNYRYEQNTNRIKYGTVHLLRNGE
jgi:gliding motility-associated-like protein